MTATEARAEFVDAAIHSGEIEGCQTPPAQTPIHTSLAALIQMNLSTVFVPAVDSPNFVDPYLGKALHPSAVRLLVSADGGGSNGYRTRLWKTELAPWQRAKRHTNLIECNVLGVIMPSILAPRMPTAHCRPLRRFSQIRTRYESWQVL